MANIKKIEFTAKNVKPFSAWLKRFSLIDNSLLLELDPSENAFIAKTYNEERSVVKFSEIAFDEAGLVVSPHTESRRIKIGLYHIPRLIKVMDQFGSDPFNITFTYDEIQGESVELAGMNVILKNKSLKITIDCTSLNIFKYISDSLFKSAISNVESVIDTFDLYKGDIEKISSLSGLDNDHKYLAFSRNNGIYVSGKTFELLIGESDEANSTKSNIDIFKEQFEKIDVEDYKVKMGEDRLVFTSMNSNTVTTVSMVEKD